MAQRIALVPPTDIVRVLLCPEWCALLVRCIRSTTPPQCVSALPYVDVWFAIKNLIVNCTPERGGLPPTTGELNEVLVKINFLPVLHTETYTAAVQYENNRDIMNIGRDCLGTQTFGARGFDGEGCAPTSRMPIQAVGNCFRYLHNIQKRIEFRLEQDWLGVVTAAMLNHDLIVQSRGRRGDVAYWTVFDATNIYRYVTIAFGLAWIVGIAAMRCWVDGVCGKDRAPYIAWALVLALAPDMLRTRGGFIQYAYWRFLYKWCEWPNDNALVCSVKDSVQGLQLRQWTRVQRLQRRWRMSMTLWLGFLVSRTLHHAASAVPHERPFMSFLYAFLFPVGISLVLAGLLVRPEGVQVDSTAFIISATCDVCTAIKQRRELVVVSPLIELISD